MQDFDSFSKQVNDMPKNNTSAQSGDNYTITELVKSLCGKFDGKSENELLSAIFKEAEKGRKNGTLKDEDIERFTTLLAPMLDDKKRKKLYTIAEKLKQN